jgi:hypothetical protein
LLGIEGYIATDPLAVPIRVDASARDEYAVEGIVEEVAQLPGPAFLLSTEPLTLWGVPGSHARYEGSSGDLPSGGLGSIPPNPPAEQLPLMENPTSCATTPLTRLAIDTTEQPDVFAEALARSPIPTDCPDVPFAPSVTVETDNTGAGTPAALHFELRVPQSDTPAGRGTSDLEKAVVTLPQGMTISPSAASHLLEGCTDEQFGAGSDVPATCPAASAIGEDEVQSPLVLSGPLKGRVYLGQPLGTDPTSGTMFRIFQELQGFGLDIKLEGSVTADPSTGQLTATFSNLPELPFEDFKMSLKGGPNAVLVNPPTCGTHTANTQLYPYSNPFTPVTPSSSFQTSYDGKGAACPSSLPFSPSSSISTVSQEARALSPLTVSFSRPDSTQPLGEIDATLPKGLLGYVSKVELCQAGAALAGTCAPESRIGTVSTTAGAGQDPLTVGGSVYLAHGSDGYPFILSVVVPAVAGPYNLGNVVVPVWLQVNSDGSLTARSGALPSILDGIPLDIRSVTMSIDRPGFAVNPTNCGPLSLSGTATSLSGATAPLSAPFGVTGCGSLPFAPSFTVATRGSTSRPNGASLTVRVSQRSGEAAIRSVHVQLPKSMPTRDSTLNNACTEQQFAANPADCPRGSVVGTAVAYTPLLPVAMSGPAVLVSHAAAAFPDLDIILQGDGITIDLVGNTDIKSGVTSSTFASVPDVPISGFELNLPEGPDSILAAKGHLCEQNLVMPTTIVGQNGIMVKQNTQIGVTGCGKPTLSITAIKAGRGGLFVRARTSRTGLLRITGTGLRTTTKRVTPGSGRQIAVRFSRGDKTLRQSRALKVKATLTVDDLVVARSSKEARL